MKTIQLTRMELRNFKGAAQADYDFSPATTRISGDNATGKSTIFEAYLWCLFDKNPQGLTPKVQPLDAKNEVRHKLTTSVRLYLTLNDCPLIVERTLKEEWVKPRGAVELICKGTKSEYTINDVPMTKTQYNARLEEVLPLEQWFLLSAVGIIPAMEQKACRAALQQIAPAIDEQTLAQPYPAVLAAFAKGLNIDELQATTKQTKLRAMQELDGIPAALDAQDRLRVDDDWAEIESQLAVVKTSIAHAQAEIEALTNATLSTETTDKLRRERETLARLSQKVSQRQLAAEDAYRQERTTHERNLQAFAAETDTIARRLELNQQTTQQYLAQINTEKSRIAALRDQWKAENAETYDGDDTMQTCPTCGQPLPPEQIAAARAKAERQWNETKAARLQAIQAEAEACKQRIDRYVAADAKIAEQDAADHDRLEVLQQMNQSEEQALTALRLPADILAADKTYQSLLAQLQALTPKQGDADPTPTTNPTNDAIAQYRADIADLTAQQEALLRRLAARDTNQRIAEERTRLESRQRTLADTIAESEGIEQQVAAYRKAKITAVENGVSSLFTIVRWKMYEPNLTNDGEREICTALIDGIPYEQQNRATQINAGIDIVNAFAQAYQVSTPLFVDNAEAVNHPLDSIGQSIRLTVSTDKELKFIKD